MPTLAPPTLTDGPDGADGAVVLRLHRRDDAERCWEQCVDPVSQRWTSLPAGYTRAMALGFVTEVMPAGWADNTEWGFALEVDGRFGGTVSLRSEGPGRAEVAYGAHPDVRGTGAVTRALRLLLDWGFQEMGLEVVEWRAFVGNWASRKVAHSLGFRQEGTVRRRLPHRDGLRDAWVATLLRDDPRRPTSPWLQVPVVEAEGLVLRPWREGDVPRIVEACADAETQRWLGRLPSPYDEAAARAFLESVTEARATAEAVGWAVVDPADDVALGSVELFSLLPGTDCEVGYWVHPAARGRGVARRATRAAIAHAFDVHEVQRVCAHAASANTASRRVLERAGMTCTGTERLGTRLRGGLEDLALYDVLADERG